MRALVLVPLLAACAPSGPGGDAPIVDPDGNAYGTVTIGSQTWLAADLRTTSYADGTPIENLADSEAWRLTTTGAYADYDNDPSGPAEYGRLYNAFAVDTAALCPGGWHVPSAAEWSTLEAALGDDASQAAVPLKEAGAAHWGDGNDATNDTGFTALPGGARTSTGTFSVRGFTGYWWTSTTGTDPAYSIYRYIDVASNFILETEDYKQDGNAVRCLAD